MEIPKLKKSHAKEVDDLITFHLNQVKSKKEDISTAANALLEFEKKTRRDNDIESSKELAETILNLFIDAKDWDNLRLHTEQLCNKHAQLKQVVVQVVRTAIDSLEITAAIDAKVKLLKVLRTVSKGKIHVEIEFARATKILSKLKENDKDLVGACEVLQEINSEALGSMDFEEKFDLLLEQFRLLLETGDKTRSELIVDKFNLEWLDKKVKSPEALKKRYFGLLKRYNLEIAEDFGAASAACRNLIELENSDLSSSERRDLMKEAILYAVVAEGDAKTEKVRKELLREFKRMTDSPEMAVHFALLSLFTVEKIIEWPFRSVDLMAAISERELLGEVKVEGEKESVIVREVRRSVIEYNLKIVANRYSRVSMERLSELLNLDEEEIEETLCKEVQRKRIWAKIDRPNGIVNFEQERSAVGRLDVWSSSISKILRKTDKICHLIEREKVVHCKA